MNVEDNYGGNLDTDGNEQYGDFYGGAPVFGNTDSEENDLLDLMLDHDVNWVVEAAYKMLRKASPTVPQRQQASPTNFGQFIDENVKVQPRSSTSQSDRVPSVITIEDEQNKKHSSPTKDLQNPPKQQPEGTPPRHDHKLSPIDEAIASDFKGQKILLSKSLPALKPLDSSVQTNNQFSKTSDKKSVKGYLKGYVFDQEAVASPYLQHLKKPNPFAGVDEGYALHKAFFAQQKAKPKMHKKTDSEKAQDRIQKLSKMKFKPPTRLEMKPFTPITAKGWETLGIRQDQRTEDLFSRVEDIKQQYNAPKTLHPIVDEPKGGNIMTSKPLSAKMIRATSPTTNGYSNDIDQLVSQQFVPNNPGFRPIHSPTVATSPQQHLETAPKSRAQTTTGGVGNRAEEANRIDAMDMLANIHNDPLYRIIKEEMDRIQKATSHGSVMRIPPSDPISAAHIKVLSYFQALPPSVWVTCRLVYFLIAAYYETVILPSRFRIYREYTDLEPFWSILDRHYSELYLSLGSIAQQFSWALLQDLLKVPKLFCRALDAIENGLRMPPENWRLFHDNVEKATDEARQSSGPAGAGPAVDSRPNTRHANTAASSSSNSSGSSTPPDSVLLNVTDDESFRNVFYDSFPVQAFQPLRDMVKAGRGFLLSNTSTLFTQAGHGGPIVPGTPLAISVTLTNWVKRVIAMLYISGTQRVRMMRAQQQPLQSHNHQQSYFPSRASSPVNLYHPALSPFSPGKPYDNDYNPLSETVASRPATVGGSMVPPNLSFACVFNGLPGHFVVTTQDYDMLSASPQPSLAALLMQRYLRFFGVAASLVKPSDQLEVLLHALPAEEITTNDQNQEKNETNHVNQQPLETKLQLEIELFLRMTTSSPLHKVKRFDYQSQFPILASVRFVHPWMEALHPWLAYQVLVQAGIIRPPTALPQQYQSSNNNRNRTRASITIQSNGSSAVPATDGGHTTNEFGGNFESRSVHQNQHATKHHSSHNQENGNNNNQEASTSKVYDMVIAPFFNHMDAPHIEPLVLRDKAFQVESSLMQIVREKVSFSVALVSEGKTSPLKEDEYGIRASIKGNRYVVAVSDSPASWNAFQMACRLAKESDTIVLVHVPTLQPPTPSEQPQVNGQSGWTRGSITRSQYDQLVQAMLARRDALTSLYRTLGYNVLCGSIPTYVDYARHVMETYITSNALKTQAMNFLGSENGIHPYDGYAFYQRHMEKRMVARALIRLIQPLQPDFLVLGADANDVLNALSYHYLHPHLAFKHTVTPSRPDHSRPFTQRSQHQPQPPQQQQQQQQYDADILTIVPASIAPSAAPQRQDIGDTMTVDNITMIEVRDTDDINHPQHQQQRQRDIQEEEEGDDERDDDASQPLVVHGRMNSQLTMVSALTEVPDDAYLPASEQRLLSTSNSAAAQYAHLREFEQPQHQNQQRESDGASDTKYDYEDDDFVTADDDDEGSVSRRKLAAATSASVQPTVVSRLMTGLESDGERGVILADEESIGRSAREPVVPSMPKTKVDRLDSSLDYNDLESFIIEDNDEGENSLSASPFLPQRNFAAHFSGKPHSEESPPASNAVIASDGRFTHPLPTPIVNESTSNVAGMNIVPVQPDNDLLLRLQLFRDFSREAISFSDILLHEMSTRTHWWPAYVADEMANRQRRALSADPDETDPTIKITKRWMHESVSCILTHLPISSTTDQDTAH